MTTVWIKDPHSGGVKIPKRIQESIKNRITSYAEAHYAGKYTGIEVRFRGHFCYIDAYAEPFVPHDFDPRKCGETKEEFQECRVCARDTRRVDPSPPGLAQGDNRWCPGSPRSGSALRHKQRLQAALGLRTNPARMA
jgi:hypothetical protein